MVTTIDQIYTKPSRLYYYASGGGWFVTTGTKAAWFFDYDTREIARAHLFDLEGTNYWQVEQGNNLDCRKAIKDIFRRDTEFEI